MAFWGIEVKPGKPFVHYFNQAFGRLRISQATLGIGSAIKKTVVQCNVGNKSPVLLCSLLPDRAESCHLELEFEEVDEVIFSVFGPRSVHLTGYYLAKTQRPVNAEDDSDTYGEDIGDMDTEKSNSYDGEDKYEDSFINDDDLEVFPPSPASLFEGASMEVTDSKRRKPEKGGRRRLKKKYQLSESDDDGFMHEQIIVNDSITSEIVESKDEDQRPISSLYKSGKILDHGNSAKEKVEETAETSDKKAGIDGSDIDKSNKTVIVDGDPKRKDEEVGHELKAEMKKKRKQKLKEGKALKVDLAICNNVSEEDRDQVDDGKVDNMEQNFSVKRDHQETDSKWVDGCADHAVDEHQSDDKRDKKKKRKFHEEDKLVVDAGKSIMLPKDATVSLKGIEGKKTDQKPSEAPSFSSGLIVEELEMGGSDGKIASAGKKVTVHFTLKLKDGGLIVQSTIESEPLKFRLGKGRVIGGLDVGVDGMREGGRRRLIIPPALGYGSEGSALGVPPNSELIMDVDLIRVR
ncbi:hypothetical protein Nepgr_000747 [Nepenthes gracilis]|uniref:peptidylprolyl isomerase n=1 Tax=Nepenthes gracilis TaxID=150966 RepID=A0AAD3RX49_NEPGR|nr:hypothetical protein Nepgr_000747 [Nepenthes gracilis]